MLRLTIVSTIILWLVSSVSGAEHGTVGYGINMYHPWCCTACADLLTPLYLNCTTFSEGPSEHGMDMKKLRKRHMDMGVTATTTDECRTSSQPWLQTFAHCIHMHCDSEGIALGEQDRCFQKMAAGGLTVPHIEVSLPTVAPTEELSEDEMWLNNTMLVNEVAWQTDRATIEAFENAEKDHVKYSMVVMIITVGVPLLTRIWALGKRFSGHWIHKVTPLSLVQTYFALPALVGQRHLQPLPGKIGYAPKRALSMFVFIYVVLNIVFSAVPYHSVQPSSFFANRNSEIAAYVANRTGVLSFANMALAILFSSRTNPLIKCTGWTYTSFATLHRWAARVAIVQAVVHSIVYTIDYCYYIEGNKYATEVVQAYFWWGIIATVAMALMAGVSVLPLRLHYYEFFLVLHIILAIFSLIGSWYHVDLRFQKKFGYEVWLYLAFAFWAYDRSFRFLKMIYYSFWKYESASIESIPGTNVTCLTIHTKTQWSTGPGCHTFVYFPAFGKLWENHPFTIADWSGAKHQPSATITLTSEEDEQHSSTETKPSAKSFFEAVVSSDEIQEIKDKTPSGSFVRAFFRAHKGATTRVASSLSTRSFNKTDVLTEGSYGGHMASFDLLRNADKILCIAGGIGITWAAGFTKQFYIERLNRQNGSKIMPRCGSYTLAWTVREEGLLTYMKRNLLPDVQDAENGLDDGSLKYKFWLTGESEASSGDSALDDNTSAAAAAAATAIPGGKEARVEEHVEVVDPLTSTTRGRMEVNEVVDAFMENGRNHVVLVCGPGGLADSVRNHVVKSSRRGFVVDLLEEPFAW